MGSPPKMMKKKNKGEFSYSLEAVAVQKFESLQGYSVLPVLSLFSSCLQNKASDLLLFFLSQLLIISNSLSVGCQELAQNLVLQTQIFLLYDCGITY